MNYYLKIAGAMVLYFLLLCCNIYSAENRTIISGIELFCNGDTAELVLDVSGSAGIIGIDIVGAENIPPVQWQPFSDKQRITINDQVVIGNVYTYWITAYDNRGCAIDCGEYDVVAENILPVWGADVGTDVGAENIPPVREDVEILGIGTVINICVTNDGLFSVSASNIADCLSSYSLPDVTNNIAQTNFILTCRGNEISWLSGDSNENILFYGSTTSSLYQVGNIYQLRVGLGSLINQESVIAGTVTNGQSFLENLHFEKDIPGYFTKGESRPPPLDDFWIWDYWWLTYEIKSFNLNLPDVSAVTGIVNVGLKGYDDVLADVSNHYVEISCNGVVATSVYFKGWSQVSISVVATNLVDGINTISIEHLDTHTNSIVFLEDFDVKYLRQFSAYNDLLIFYGGSYSNITVSGFSTNKIMLFDITDEVQPLALSGMAVNQESNGLYSISFTPQSLSNRYCAAVLPIDVKSMQGVNEVELLSPTNGADYILIAASGFSDGCIPLINQRNAQGLKTMLLDVEQVYDVFADGGVTPNAIKDFLAYAYTNWSIAPRYVVLAGAGNWDFLDKQQDDPWDPCLIPPLMYYMNNNDQTEWLGVDVPFGDVEGDAVPEVIVGRLPAADTNELATVVSKIIDYERQVDMVWKSGVSLLADNNDIAGDFHGDSDFLAGLIPISRQANKIYLTNASYTAAVRAEIINSLNLGVGFLSYLGHGNPDRVADEDLINNVSLFTNLLRPSVMFAFTCELGCFAPPVGTRHGLSERMISSELGGYVAVWAPTSVSYEVAGVNIATHLFESIFQQNALRLGDAVKCAFDNFDAGSIYDFLLKTFEFLGDPAMIIAPGAYSFDGWRMEYFTADELTNSVIGVWDADPDGDGISNLEEYNAGTNPTNYNDRVEFYGGLDPVVSGSETNYYISVSFPQVKWSVDVNTYVDICYDLMKKNWFDATALFDQVSQDELNAEAERVTLRMIDNTNIVERKVFLRTRTEIK